MVFWSPIQSSKKEPPKKFFTIMDSAGVVLMQWDMNTRGLPVIPQIKSRILINGSERIVTDVCINYEADFIGADKDCHGVVIKVK